MVLGWIIGSKLGRRLGAALAAAAAVLVLIWEMRRGIRRNAKLEQETDRLRGAVEADRRMDHADTGDGASDADNREWLHKRGARRGKPRS